MDNVSNWVFRLFIPLSDKGHIRLPVKTVVSIVQTRLLMYISDKGC